MYRYLILGLLLPFFTACSNIDGLENRFSPNPELSEEQEKSDQSALEIPRDFPAIIPQYSNSELQEISDTLNQQQGLVRWSSSDSVKQISDFYQQYPG